MQTSPQASDSRLQSKDKRKSANLTPINQSLNMGEAYHKSIVIIGRT